MPAHRTATVAAAITTAAVALTVVVALAMSLGGSGGEDATLPSPASSERSATTDPSPIEPPATRPSAPPPTPSPRASPAVSASAIVPGSVDRASLDLVATYDVDLGLGYDDRTIVVASTMVVTNESGGPIDRLELNTIAARLGDIDLGATTVDGRSVEVAIDDQTLVVPLGGILPDGASATASIAYSATLRDDLAGSNWLFTRANGIVNAYRWLPWVSRRVPFDRPNHGDPFVTPVSPRVEVRVTGDRALTIATTGEAAASEGRTTTFVATDVRDFTLTASPTYRTSARKVGDTTIRVYYREGAPAAAMFSAAEEALLRYEQLVGPYPYDTLDIAQSAGGYGMEGPGIVWIPAGASNLRYLVHHEVAHQWFYGLVGGDQAAEPFTDEAPADFLARRVLGQRRASRCDGARLDLAIYDYSAACYYEVVYIQGGNLLDDVRRSMGDAAFWAGLRDWTDEHRFEIASTRSLLETLDAHTPLDLVQRFAPRFPRLY